VKVRRDSRLISLSAAIYSAGEGLEQIAELAAPVWQLLNEFLPKTRGGHKR